jgi:hypothetical protein
MSDCSTCAGTVPVTPTRWSSAWFTYLSPKARAASTSSGKLVPGLLKMKVSAVVPCSEEVKTSLTLTTGTAAAMGPTSPIVPLATPAARSTARFCAPADRPDSLRCTSRVRLSSGKPKASAEARSVAMALLSGGAKPPRSAGSAVAGIQNTAAATAAAQPSTMGQRSATTHQAYSRPSAPASDLRHDLIDPPFLSRPRFPRGGYPKGDAGNLPAGLCLPTFWPGNRATAARTAEKPVCVCWTSRRPRAQTP